MCNLERFKKALFYLQKENEIAKKMFEAKIQEKDIRKLRKKIKDLKIDSSQYDFEKKAIISALLILDTDMNVNELNDDFLKKLEC